MKLDRNAPNNRGKYAIVRLRNIEAGPLAQVEQLAFGGFVEFSNVGDKDEFFVIRLRDKYAAAALSAYAKAALVDDPEYAGEVLEMAARAAQHPLRRKPD